MRDWIAHTHNAHNNSYVTPRECEAGVSVLKDLNFSCDGLSAKDLAKNAPRLHGRLHIGNAAVKALHCALRLRAATTESDFHGVFIQSFELMAVAVSSQLAYTFFSTFQSAAVLLLSLVALSDVLHQGIYLLVSAKPVVRNYNCFVSGGYVFLHAVAVQRWVIPIVDRAEFRASRGMTNWDHYHLVYSSQGLVFFVTSIVRAVQWIRSSEFRRADAMLHDDVAPVPSVGNGLPNGRSMHRA